MAEVMHGRPRLVHRALAVALIAVGLPLAAVGPVEAARLKTITITDTSIIEGNAGQQNLAFTLTWTGSKGGAAPSVQYATADGTATAGDDYTATSGTANLTNGGCRCATVNVPVKGDVTTEGTETFVVNLSNPSNATVADAQATGTVYDNEGSPSLVVGDLAANESAGSLGFTVQLTNPSASTVTVDYATADGTATAGDDYTATDGTVTFTPGQTSKPVTVTVASDDLAEDDETVLLDLSNPTNAAIVDAQGIGSIVNDDADPTVSIAEASVDEADPTAALTISLDAASGRETEIDYATDDGTAVAGDDYTATSGTLTIAAGATSATIDLPVTLDTLHEGDETLTVTLSGEVNLTLGTASATVTIADDDPVPTVAAADVSTGESASTVSVTIALSNPTLDEVTFDWATVDQTATGGADYVAASGSGSIAAGETSTTVDLTLTSDRTDEPNETLAIALTNVAGAVVGADGIVTLTDDDKTPTALTVRVAKTKTVIKAKGVLEPATTGLSVTVTLSKKKGTRFVKVATKTVAVRGLKDRDGDGKIDGAFRAPFPRPAKGTYRFTVVFSGTPDLRKTARSLTFKL